MPAGQFEEHAYERVHILIPPGGHIRSRNVLEALRCTQLDFQEQVGQLAFLLEDVLQSLAHQ